jgi:type II secretion system protein H
MMQVGQAANVVGGRERWGRGCEGVSRPHPISSHRRPSGFTLLEVMMVVAIIGLMMTMGVPAILRAVHQEPLNKAVNDVMNICNHARAQAILHGVITSVVFHPQSKEVTLVGVTSTNSPDNFASPDTPSGKTQTFASGAAVALNSMHFDDSVNIDMLDVNFQEYKDAPEARVRFFPNGTCDEMTLIVNSGSEYREVSLEVTTGRTYLQVIR